MSTSTRVVPVSLSADVRREYTIGYSLFAVDFALAGLFSVRFNNE